MFCDNQFKGEVSISNIFSLEKRKVCIKIPFPVGKIVLIIFMNWERKSNLIIHTRLWSREKPFTQIFPSFILSFKCIINSLPGSFQQFPRGLLI